MMATGGWGWWWPGGPAELMRGPAVVETLLDLLLCAVGIWVAVTIGIVIGWSWRPQWTGLVFLGLRGRLRSRWLRIFSPGSGAGRLWLAFTALSALPVCRRLWTHFRGKGYRSAVGTEDMDAAADDDEAAALQPVEARGCSSDSDKEGEDIVTVKDLEHFLHLLDNKVVDASWQHLMEHTTQNMTYQAWRHESEMGPLIHCSRTVFEDATPELVRDFFWDDDFRLQWDPMLAYFKLLEELPSTGTSIIHWIKKFPFFCSDREYIIGRRIWESGKTYYCVTKGVPYPSLQKKGKPRRVDLYFSSWRIRAVESRKQDGLLSSCEVTLIHYEDMGIPKDVAKVAVRHGMWGAVKKLQSGMRSYQLARKSNPALSRSALMAQNMTKIPADGIICSMEAERSEAHDAQGVQRTGQGFDWKWVLIGGTVAVVCGIKIGIIGKVMMFGAARRLARK